MRRTTLVSVLALHIAIVIAGCGDGASPTEPREVYLDRPGGRSASIDEATEQSLPTQPARLRARP